MIKRIILNSTIIIGILNILSYIMTFLGGYILPNSIVEKLSKPLWVYFQKSIWLSLISLLVGLLIVIISGNNIANKSRLIANFSLHIVYIIMFVAFIIIIGASF